MAKKIHLDEAPIVTADDGTQYRINPSAIGASQLNVELPEVEVKGKKKGAYKSSFDPTAAWEFTGHYPLQYLSKGLDAITPDIIKPVMPYLSPSQWAGTLKGRGLPGSSTNNGFGDSKMDQYLNELFDAGLYGKALAKTPVNAIDAAAFLKNTGKWSYGVARNIKNKNRHAYVTIDPVGYDNPVDRFKKYAKSILSGKDVDIDAVNPLDRTATTDYVKYNYEKAGKHRTSLDNMTRIARDEAWRKYLGLPSRYSIYLDNGDGTFSYNIPEIEKLAGTKYKPYPLDKMTHSDVFDNVTGNGGGLTKSEVHTSVAPYTNDIGLRDIIGKQIIEDVWDLHPFSRAQDLLSAKYAKGMQNMLNNTYQKLYPYLYSMDKPYGKFAYNNLGGSLLNKMRNGSMTGAKVSGWEIPKLPFADTVIKLSDKLKDYEVGPVLGGKPFKMHTEIPFTKKIKTFSKDPAKNIMLKAKGQDPFFDYNYGYEGIVPDGILDWDKWTNKNAYNIIDLNKLNDMINKTKSYKVNKKAYGGHIHLEEL